MMTQWCSRMVCLLVTIVSLQNPALGGQVNLSASVTGAFYSDFSPAPLGNLSGPQPTSLIYQIDFLVSATTSPGEREFGATSFNVDLQGLVSAPGLGWSPAEGASCFTINGDLGPSSVDLQGIVVSKSIIGSGLSSATPDNNGPLHVGSLFVEWDGQSYATLSWGNVEAGFILEDGKFGRAMPYAGGTLEFGSSLTPVVIPPVEPAVEPPPVIEPPAIEPPPVEPQLPPPPVEEPPKPEVPPEVAPEPRDPVEPSEITTFSHPQLELRYWYEIEELVLDPAQWQGGALFLHGDAFPAGHSLFDPSAPPWRAIAGDAVTTNSIASLFSSQLNRLGSADSSADGLAAPVPEPSTLLLSLLLLVVSGGIARRHPRAIMQASPK